MVKVLVLYYSSYGHIERMAVAEGARSVGAEVDIKRVPELVPNKVALASHYKLDQIAPVAQIDDLVDYDAIIFGTPTRFGNMAAQMKNFIDQAGGLWAKDKLIGKVGSVFTASATQHGGQEATLLSFHIVLLHLGFIVVGLPYSFKGQMGVKEVHGATPYGATTIVGAAARACPPRWRSMQRITKAVMSPGSRMVATACGGRAAAPGLRTQEPRRRRDAPHR
jgi:NAD(P)H dehydrogenase (quinone)